MVEVERVLKARLAASVYVLQVLDGKARMAQQSVPPASGMLDNFRSWLALKTAKNAYAGGLYPKMERAYSSLNARGDGNALQKALGGNPSGASLKAVTTQQTGQSRAVIETKSAHDDALKYRKAADEKFRGAAEELWRRGEKAQSGELDRFRKEMASDMGEAARWLEEGLKAHTVASEGYYAATLGESVGGLQRLALAAAEPASCPHSQIDFHEGQITEATKRQDYWKSKLNGDKATCNAGKMSAELCKQFIDGDNFFIDLEQKTIDSHVKDKESLLKLCAPKPPEPPKSPVDKNPCPKENTACAAIKLPSTSLTAEQKALSNEALTFISKLPKTNPASDLLPLLQRGKKNPADLIQALRDGRIEVRAVKPEDLPGGFGAAYSERNPKDKKMYSILLVREDVFKSKSPAAIAATLAHELSHIQTQTTFKKDGTRVDGNNELLSQQKAFLTEIYVFEEMRIQKKVKPQETAKLCPDKSLYCENMRALPRIWEGKLGGLVETAKVFPPEFTDKKIVGMIKNAKNKESKGRSGTEQILEIISNSDEFKGYDKKKWSSKQQKAQEEFKSLITGKDDAFRKAHGKDDIAQPKAPGKKK